jgi:hypothetical protein
MIPLNNVPRGTFGAKGESQQQKSSHVKVSVRIPVPVITTRSQRGSFYKKISVGERDGVRGYDCFIAVISWAFSLFSTAPLFASLYLLCLRHAHPQVALIPITPEDAASNSTACIELETFFNRKTSPYLKVWLRFFSIKTFQFLAICLL